MINKSRLKSSKILHPKNTSLLSFSSFHAVVINSNAFQRFELRDTQIPIESSSNFPYSKFSKFSPAPRLSSYWRKNRGSVSPLLCIANQVLGRTWSPGSNTLTWSRLRSAIFKSETHSKMFLSADLADGLRKRKSAEFWASTSGVPCRSGGGSGCGWKLVFIHGWIFVSELLVSLEGEKLFSSWEDGSSSTLPWPKKKLVE